MTTPEQPTVEQRADAARLAQDVLSYLDHDIDDVLALADWLLTGRADIALAMAEQRTRNYTQRDGDLGPDAARWTPPARSSTGGGIDELYAAVQLDTAIRANRAVAQARLADPNGPKRFADGD